MEDVIKGEIGAEGAYDVDFKGGKIVLNAKYMGQQAEAGLMVAVSVDAFMDKLKMAIPGAVDDAIIDVIKIALKAV